VFPDLTVEENLRTGAFLRSDKAEIDKDLDEVFHHFPRLKERRRQWARSLSGGEQQMLAIGRALMSGELALKLARYAYVLETGSIALEGPAHELHDNEHVKRAYLGA